MKKTIIAVAVFVPALFLTSCAVTTTSAYPGYRGDYVYSVGYYGVQPGWSDVGYWRGYRGYSNRGWWSYRW
ncbi:MAG: hypothetical protein WC785_00520 [Tatlockia sp.]|jgi:hypothetical protein